MKKLLIAILIVASTGTAFAASQYQRFWKGDGAFSATVNSTGTNTPTKIDKCYVTCVPNRAGETNGDTAYTSSCVVALQRFASVTTGSWYQTGPTLGTFAGMPRNAHLYSISMTGTTKITTEQRSGSSSVTFLPNWPNGVYWNDLTGTTYKNCTFYK